MAEPKPKLPARTSLIGDKVYLRPASTDDIINFDYWTMLSQPEMLSCHPTPFRTGTEAVQQYTAKEKTIAEQSFAILRKDGQVPVGTVSFFNYNSLNRSAELGLLIDPDERRKGYGADALQVLSRYLFKHRGLNKVYAQTCAANEAACKLLESLSFKKDGTLRDHYFFNGGFHHGLIYSLLLFELHW